MFANQTPPPIPTRSNLPPVSSKTSGFTNFVNNNSGAMGQIANVAGAMGSSNNELHPEQQASRQAVHGILQKTGP